MTEGGRQGGQPTWDVSWESEDGLLWVDGRPAVSPLLTLRDVAAIRQALQSAVSSTDTDELADWFERLERELLARTRNT